MPEIKLNKNERARLEQIREWARGQLRADLDARQIPGIEKLFEFAAARGYDPTLGPNSCLWLIKLIDKAFGTAPSARKLTDTLDELKRRP